MTKRFLILWKWSIVEKIVLDRRHFRIWMSAYNWRITKRAIQKVYEKKLRQAMDVWLYHVRDFNNKIALTVAADRRLRMHTSLRGWRSLRIAMRFDYKFSRLRTLRHLDSNRRLNQVSILQRWAAITSSILIICSQIPFFIYPLSLSDDFAPGIHF